MLIVGSRERYVNERGASRVLSSLLKRVAASRFMVKFDMCIQVKSLDLFSQEIQRQPMIRVLTCIVNPNVEFLYF